MAARLLRHLLSALARAFGELARGLDRAARTLEATEAAACARTPQLLPAELMLESESETQSSTTATARLQPPPIPAAALRVPADTKRQPTEQERAWQELTNGRHPRLILSSRPAPSGTAAGPV